MPTAPQDVTLDKKYLCNAAAAADVIIPETPCSLDIVKPKEDFTPNKPMNTHNKKWDIVYLTDLNQKFLNRNRLFFKPQPQTERKGAGSSHRNGSGMDVTCGQKLSGLGSEEWDSDFNL